MDWPTERVELIDPDEFRPPFCPNPDCVAHRDAARRRFLRHGFYVRQSLPRVRRHRCVLCGKTCSQQTFSCTYYMKRPELLAPVAAGLNAGSAHRQLARSLRCGPSSVTRIAARLGRHAILLQATALASVKKIEESIVYDDFESFVYSQDYPLGIGTTAGQESWFTYTIDQAPHRRGGKKPLKRSARRARPSLPGAGRRAFARMLDQLVPKSTGKLRVVSDDHPAYRGGLRNHPLRDRVEHAIFANPKRGPKGSPRSSRARRRDREMFPVDLLHKLMRHSLSHHRRETIAFARRVDALLERVFLFVVWRNFVKHRTERRNHPITPAMSIGITDRPWPWGRVLAQRLFPGRIELPTVWESIYRRRIPRPFDDSTQFHALKNAF